VSSSPIPIPIAFAIAATTPGIEVFVIALPITPNAVLTIDVGDIEVIPETAFEILVPILERD
jgi:hypothetical protein